MTIKVKVCGITNEKEMTYVFDKIDANHTIEVICEKYLSIETEIENGEITNLFNKGLLYIILEIAVANK